MNFNPTHDIKLQRAVQKHFRNSVALQYLLAIIISWFTLLMSNKALSGIQTSLIQL